MHLEDILNDINTIIEAYESGKYMSSENLRKMLRELSAKYHYLTINNIDAYQRWNNAIYNREEKVSVASAKVKADEEVPELRITRKILQAVDHVIWSMRSELSIIKKD